MNTLLRDLKYGFRTMRRTPGFTVIALLTIALAIGANTAIFSVVNAAMLRPLPFTDANRLVRIFHSYSHLGLARVTVSPDGFAYYRDHGKAFESVAASTGYQAPANLTTGGEPEHVFVAKSTANLFSTLRAVPMVGRTFTAEEDKPGSRVAVLGYGLWQSRFGGNPQILGTDIALDDKNYTVVGVMPKDFAYPDKAQIWVPMAFTPAEATEGSEYLDVVARLKPGVSMAQAQADMARLTKEVERKANEPNTEGWSAITMPMQKADSSELRVALWALLAAVLSVLLIAAANLANLLLAKAISRQREIAIRTALGASRFRVVRQMLTEGMMLAAGGGVLGVLAGYLAIRNLLAYMPLDLPTYITVKIDTNVLLFAFLLVVLTGVVFSVIPALKVTSEGISETLKSRSNRETARGGVRSIIVIGEFALALTLLVTAGLLIRTFIAIQGTDPGFRAQNVMTARLALPGARYTPERSVQFFHELLQRLQGAPGVKRVAIGTGLPLSGGWMSSFDVQGKQFSVHPHAHMVVVSDDYFSTLSIPVRKGRTFTASDTADSSPVVIIDDKAARAYFAGEDPIGKRIGFRAEPGKPQKWMEVVGVVGSVKHKSPLEDETKGALYLPMEQMPLPFAVVVMQAAGDPEQVLPVLRNELKALDPTLPINEAKTMEVVLDEFVAQPRFNMELLASFAGLALVLATIGIYGVVAYTVTQRTQEIGIRMALGAQRSDVLGMILKYGLKMALVGVVLGVVASIGASRLVASMLFGIKPSDPLTLGIVCAALTTTALLASYIPAWRATRVDPAITLRQQ